jgi:DNA-binding XRE family transcriptional regulator
MPVARSNRQRQMFNELRSVRSSRSLTRQQLADLVDVNVQTIGALERGHYSPSLYLALLIANALDVDLGKVFWLAEVDADGQPGPDGSAGGSPEMVPMPHK